MPTQDLPRLGEPPFDHGEERPRRGLARHKKWARVSLFAGAVGIDLLALILASALAAFLRFGELRSESSNVFILLFGLPFYLAAFAFGAYRFPVLRTATRSAALGVLAVVIATAAALAAAFALKAGEQFSRLETGFMALGSAYFVAAGRTIIARIAHRLRHAIEPSSFILADHDADSSSDMCVGSINVYRRGWAPKHDDPAFLSELFRAVEGADRVLLRFSDSVERARWIEVMRFLGIDAEAIEPDLGRTLPLGIGFWEGSPTLIIARGPLQLHERVQKRLFDLVVAGGLLIALSPLMLIVAILIKLESPGPALFVQQRLGRNNQPYSCYKFRTMRRDAVDPEGRQSTRRDDPRITRLGRLLRCTSFDELPQFINVLKGEMSLVGPRPHAAASTAAGQLFWEVVPGYWCRHAIKPGITGLAQVQGLRGATHALEDIEQRVAADMEYISNWSLWLDLKILLKTVRVVIHKNAY